MGSLRQGLVDPSAYVRKTAVMGCAKLFALVPHTIKGSCSLPIVKESLEFPACSVSFVVPVASFTRSLARVTYRITRTVRQTRI